MKQNTRIRIFSSVLILLIVVILFMVVSIECDRCLSSLYPETPVEPEQINFLKIKEVNGELEIDLTNMPKPYGVLKITSIYTGDVIYDGDINDLFDEEIYEKPLKIWINQSGLDNLTGVRVKYTFPKTNYEIENSARWN